MNRAVWGFVGLGLLTVLAGAVVALDRAWVVRSSCTNDRNAASTLRTFVAAEEDLRAHDRDGDGRREYWRADVAGLYGLVPRNSGEMLKLIEISSAGADIAPVGGGSVVHPEFYADSVPKAGYWFAALRFADELDGAPDPDRFAFCAAPDSLSSGREVFAISHAGVLWRRPARGPKDIPICFPLDPAKAGWRTCP